MNRKEIYQIYQKLKKNPINFQEVKGKAKPYQVRQFIKIIEKYNLVGG